MSNPIQGAGAGPGGLPPGFGAPVPPRTQRQLQIRLPEDSPIPSAISFSPSVTFASAGAGTTGPLVVTQLPGNSIGVVQVIEVDILNLLQTSAISWSFLVNGAPAPGFNNITIFPGSVPRVSKVLDELTLRVPQGATLSMTFTNTDGAAYPVVGMSYYGWFWSLAADRWWKGTNPE